MTLVERIVTAMIDYNIDEEHTVGELLHAIRMGQKNRPIRASSEEEVYDDSPKS